MGLCVQGLDFANKYGHTFVTGLADVSSHIVLNVHIRLFKRVEGSVGKGFCKVGTFIGNTVTSSFEEVFLG